MITAVGIIIGLLGIASFIMACVEVTADNFDNVFVCVVLMLILVPLGFSIAALSSI